MIKTCSFLGIRHRYILTRSNVPRLRYIVPMLVAFILTTVGVTILATGKQAMQMASAPTVNVKAEEYLFKDPEVIVEQGEGRKQVLASLFTEQDDLSSSEKVPPEPKKISLAETITVRSGDTLSKMLEKQNIPSGETRKIISELTKVWNPRYVRPGQNIALNFDEDDSHETGRRFASLQIVLDPVSTVNVRRKGDKFAASEDEKDLKRQMAVKEAIVTKSLRKAIAAAGIPKSVMTKLTKLYSWNTDFQRDIRKGDRIQVMYEQLVTEDGYVVKNGDVQFANLILNGRSKPMYRYKRRDGYIDYYDKRATNARKTLLKTPIDGARISSGFGRRRHPVLGYSKMHKGVDFAARRGTPIYAAGDGKIETAGWVRGYGKYIRIRHNGTYKTAYAHMNGFAKGIKGGSRVRQGQVIGYVGTTGRSTGPHLHYEVLKKGVQVNPQSMKLPTGETLSGKERVAFNTKRQSIEKQYAAIAGHGVQFAARVPTPKRRPTK